MEKFERRTLSQATAMHLLAAAFIFVVWPCRLHAHTPTNDFYSLVLPALGISRQGPLHRLVKCANTLGPIKCFSALSSWRAENAVDIFDKGDIHNVQFNITSDIENFSWEQYTNQSQDEMYSKLCENTDKLLQYQSLMVTPVSGFKLKLTSKGNGKLNVNIFRDKIMGRSNKRFQKQFYNIVPYLLVPGLIMSAILPFVLPALKLMTVGAGMLNNMALTGAVFTLLRNNAFNDNYQHKIVYSNEGYKNEKRYKVHKPRSKPIEHFDKKHTGSNNETFGDFEDLEQIPIVTDWGEQIDHYKFYEEEPKYISALEREDLRSDRYYEKHLAKNQDTG